jgi:hypothetical protein
MFKTISFVEVCLERLASNVVQVFYTKSCMHVFGAISLREYPFCVYE